MYIVHSNSSLFSQKVIRIYGLLWDVALRGSCDGTATELILSRILRRQMGLTHMCFVRLYSSRVLSREDGGVPYTYQLQLMPVTQPTRLKYTPPGVRRIIICYRTNNLEHSLNRDFTRHCSAEIGVRVTGQQTCRKRMRAD
jgi:hypothetical protein